MPKVFLTVVSNNIPNLARWLTLWSEHGDHDGIVVMQDLDSVVPLGMATEVCRADARADGFGDIVAFGGASARSYAVVVAKRMGADFIVSMDDDCLPQNGDSRFCKAHLDAMRANRWDDLIVGHRTRGIPYSDRGEVRASMNIGLWSGLADLDSIQLALGERTVPLPNGTRLIGRGQYFPLSSGNACFDASLLALMLMPDMSANAPYIRFDDIWAGVIAKRVMDHLGLLVSVGTPFVEHRSPVKAFSRLEKEAAAMSVNEWFWRRIDAMTLVYNTISECTLQIATLMQRWDEPYFKDYGRRLAAWIEKVS